MLSISHLMDNTRFQVSPIVLQRYKKHSESYPFWKTFIRLNNVNQLLINSLKIILENLTIILVFKKVYFAILKETI